MNDKTLITLNFVFRMIFEFKAPRKWIMSRLAHIAPSKTVETYLHDCFNELLHTLASHDIDQSVMPQNQIITFTKFTQSFPTQFQSLPGHTSYKNEWRINSYWNILIGIQHRLYIDDSRKSSHGISLYTGITISSIVEHFHSFWQRRKELDWTVKLNSEDEYWFTHSGHLQ